MEKKIIGDEPITGFHERSDDNSEGNTIYGLTIRQHFAAMAMQGILAGVNSSEQAWVGYTKTAYNKGITIDDLVANNALDAADALITALNQPR